MLHPTAEFPHPKPKLAFLGAGTVGTALARLLAMRGYPVVAVYSRSERSRDRLAEQAGALPVDRPHVASLGADLVFITTTDDAIEGICRTVAAAGGWRAGQGVVHCSGALSSRDALSSAADAGAHIGALHPLQTFAHIDAAIAHLPGSHFGLEADAPLFMTLSAIVSDLGGHILTLSPDDKTLYHAAAVFACNYAVGLFGIAVRLLVGLDIPAHDAEAALLPLLEGTVHNLGAVGLPDALTGPLARGDTNTIARHLHALGEHDPALAALYRALARVTLPVADAKGQLTESQRIAIEALIAEDGGPREKNG